MGKFTKRDEKIFADLKACIKESGLPIKAEHQDGPFMVIETKFDYAVYPIKIIILLDSPYDTVTATIHYGIVPSNKIEILYDLINRINMLLCTSHFAVHPETGKLALLSGMYFTEDRINKQKFQIILKHLLNDSRNFAPLIREQVESDEKPVEMFRKFLEENKDLSALLKLYERKR